MAFLKPRESELSDLVGIIRHIRRRWRLKLAMRGIVLVAALAVTALVAAAFGLESWRFSPNSIITFRVLLSVAVAALVGIFFVRPLLRRVSDEQVAMYLEEHEPSLQAEIISAVSVARDGGSDARSSALARRLVESAVEKVRHIEYAHGIERTPLRRYAGAFAAIAIAAVAIFTLGPAFLRHALSALLVVSRSVEAAVPYRIDVTPGDATVPRGADQTVTATLAGFDADQAALMVRKAPDAPFERMPLIRADNKYEGMLFDLASPLDYYVEAAGVRSAIYTLKVVDLPYVQRLELEYHFPAYTGLSPRKIEDGGDIAVLAGTEIKVRVVPTMTAKGGQLVLHDKATAALTSAGDGSLSTSFKVDRDGFYRVELDAPTGERVAASPQYTIDVLTDQPPIVSISKPGRDTTASPIEEVFVEASAEDDFGVRDLELVYSVNGGAEKSIRLFDGKSRLADVKAGHTFYLEELDVQAGDFVSYFARAADNDAVAGPKRAASDLYFLQIRPLRKEFRRAESQAGGGGGGGGGEVGALSQQQRQIISATFNVQRDRKTMTAEKLKENAVVVALAQARLREQVEGLLTRMNSRLIEQDPSFKKIADLLPQAVSHMTAAEAKLRAPDPQGALEPEQKALQALQKAEEEYELQVSMQRGGGGGGGGQSSMAQDLADLFELELDRMANQYETSQRATQQNTDQRIDELMEKLKELARRQEQEAEAQRRRAAAGQQGGAGGSGGNQQRALAEQAEEAARRLEQLSREENRPELAQTARQLREAADAMRRASASGDPSAAGQAGQALDRLREAERRLQQSQSGRAERDVRNALAEAEELAREQQELTEAAANALGSSGEGRQQRTDQVAQRKDQLASRVGQLEQQLNRSAADIARTERDASRKMAEAAGTMRDNAVKDRLGWTQRMLRDPRTQPSDMQALDRHIGSTLDAVRDKLREAVSALGRSRPDAMTEAMNKARDLARGTESMDQRMRERQQRGSQGQQGQQGAQGQQGQRGQGQQGQEGQQGQGQQGQGQQGQGQQGQGQQGQGQQGQQGQQGSEGQGGRGGNNDGQRTQDGRGGSGDTTGPWRDGGGAFGDRRPGRFTPEDIRQFRGEARQWASQAEQLRRLLQGQPDRMDTRQLDEVLKGLRALQDDRVYHDAEELARLQTAVAEGMKRFEFALRRRAESAAGQPVLSGADEVPEQFRKLVEQYYKSLSKGSDKK
jgi:hypothetical protein